MSGMSRRRSPDGLTDRERAICLAVDAGLNDLAAFREACPNSGANDHTARRTVERIRKQPHCAVFLHQLHAISMARHMRRKDRVIEELANIAFADASDLFRWGPDGVTITDVADLTPAQRRLVAKASTTKTAQGGTTRLEIYDKLSALDKLCKLFGLYAPYGRELTGRDGGAIETVEHMPLSDVERAQRLAAILRGADKTDA
ncbi:MAG: hypothetical protein GKS00_09250 [Alphaproteobacteria bacterium]|nr:hypothetical protein [Alphaproteobacteria bacterium]